MQAYRKKGEVPTSIVLVDDQATVRRGPRMRLTIDPDVEVVGEAESGEAALRLVRSVSPDVILMDAEMPGMDRIAATAAQLTTAPHVAMVSCAMYYSETTLRQRGGELS